MFFFFPFLQCSCGPAYSAGLIGKKDVPPPTAVVKSRSHHRPRGEGRERGGERRWAGSNSLGPLHQSQVGQEGVFVGGG